MLLFFLSFFFDSKNNTQKVPWIINRLFCHWNPGQSPISSINKRGTLIICLFQSIFHAPEIHCRSENRGFSITFTYPQVAQCFFGESFSNVFAGRTVRCGYPIVLFIIFVLFLFIIIFVLFVCTIALIIHSITRLVRNQLIADCTKRNISLILCTEIDSILFKFDK